MRLCQRNSKYGGTEDFDVWRLKILAEQRLDVATFKVLLGLRDEKSIATLFPAGLLRLAVFGRRGWAVILGVV